jgi:hypothetical protein
MSNEDYRQGYKDGFKDGIEEGKKQNDKTWLDGYMEGLKQVTPPPYNPLDSFKIPTTPFEWLRNDTLGHCSTCGMTFNGPMGYVCTHPCCPSRVTCSDNGPSIGAVGAGEPVSRNWNDLQWRDESDALKYR